MAETEETTERDYTKAVAKEATPLQARFVPWITDKTGYDPSTAKTKAEAFAMGVKLAVSLRIEFQASPENRAAIAESRAKSAAAAEAPAEAPAAPRRGRPAKAAAPAAPVEAPVETPAAAKPPARRRRAAASSGAAF